MIELALLIGIVYWIGSDLGERAGTIALAVVILLVLGILAGAWKKNDRAYGNFVEYWSEGGPDRERR